MAKTPEQKMIEKQMQQQKKFAAEEKIRNRAQGLVGKAYFVQNFQIIDSESEAFLSEILEQYNGNENNHVNFSMEKLPVSLRDNSAVFYEALQMYGMLSSVIQYVSGAILTISESAKRYFTDKSRAIELEKKEKDKIDMAFKEKAHKQYDVFISHANADKIDYVDELYLAIRKLGINIFYDSEVLSWGDEWKKVILEGTESSEFAIIIISENFFGREWTEKELSEFLSRQNESGQKIILPLLHNISVEDLKAKYPELGDLQCITTEKYSKGDITLLLAKELIKRYK